MEETDNPTGIPPIESAQCRDECQKIRQGMRHAYIRWRTCPSGEADVVAFCRAILKSTRVKKISFHYYDVTDSSHAALATCLASCKRLEEVVLRGSNTTSLLSSIARNDRIRSLKMYSWVSEASALANLIRKTTGIKKLTIGLELGHHSSYSADEIASLAEACLRNQSIEGLSLAGFDGFKDIPLGSALLSGLGPKLTTLELNRSFDGVAVGTLLLHSQQLKTLRFKSIRLSPEEWLAIRDGLSQNFSLRELDFDGKYTELNSLHLVDIVRAAPALERFRVESSRFYNTHGWHSVFDSLAHHPNIRNIMLPTEERLDLGTDLANLLERSSSLEDLDLGDLSDDGLDGLARGLAATTSLVDLTIGLGRYVRMDSFQLLCENCFSQCPTLERLHLSLGASRLNIGPLSRFVKENRTLRCLRLGFPEQVEEVKRHRALTALLDAMAFNDVLEEFRLDGRVAHSDEDLANSLSVALPKLWKLKALNIRDVQLNRETESVLRQLDLNMSLTDFALGPRYPEDEHSKKQIRRIIKRNRALDASDYGLTAAPSLWPPMIHLALRNEHVGPSMVYRLLSKRPGVVASYVPVTNVRPASDDCYEDDGGGASGSGIARRRKK